MYRFFPAECRDGFAMFQGREMEGWREEKVAIEQKKEQRIRREECGKLFRESGRNEGGIGEGSQVEEQEIEGEGKYRL